MYRRGLCTDLLRKIHAAVAPPTLGEYRPLLRDLPDGTHVVTGKMMDRQQSGVLGRIAGWEPATLEYKVSPRDGTVPPGIILVRPEQVLPLHHEISAPL
jgi:hypothetical protein